MIWKKGFDYYAVMNEIDSNSHLYITKEPSMDFDIRRSFELLGDIGKQDWTDEDSDGLFKMVCHYISRYVYRLYGMSYINRWMREHQGSSFIDLFTASDVAYTNMVIYGNSRVWEQAIEIKNMDVEELGGTKCAIREVGVNVRRVIVKIEVTINW